MIMIVGHSSVEMFLRYRAVDDEELDAARQKLEARQAYTTPHPGASSHIIVMSRGWVALVPRDRIELSTPAFSGLCSAN
jgi:hypothetical protein